eukprot:COSAG05_NODE_4516_length_1481_cov_2.200434_2_plen_133_part_00
MDGSFRLNDPLMDTWMLSNDSEVGSNADATNDRKSVARALEKELGQREIAGAEKLPMSGTAPLPEPEPQDDSASASGGGGGGGGGGGAEAGEAAREPLPPPVLLLAATADAPQGNGRAAPQSSLSTMAQPAP